MAREIKFRAKRIDNGEWVYGHYTEGAPGYHYITNSNGPVWHVRPETVGQFTGAKSTGIVQDVYQGDICTATFKTAGGWFDLTGKIVMYDYMWCLETADEFYSLNRVTIIDVEGNIY